VLLAVVLRRRLPCTASSSAENLRQGLLHARRSAHARVLLFRRPAPRVDAPRAARPLGGDVGAPLLLDRASGSRDIDHRVTPEREELSPALCHQYDDALEIDPEAGLSGRGGHPLLLSVVCRRRLSCCHSVAVRVIEQTSESWLYRNTQGSARRPQSSSTLWAHHYTAVPDTDPECCGHA